MMIDILDSFKSNKVADECRSAGNKLYCERNFFDALLKYNESLCYAVCGGEAISLAYANRSAVYFEMKLFGKCMRNIELALSSGYPQKNFYILEKRREKCMELLSEGGDQENVLENPFDFVKLSYKENPRLPFVVDCLELKQSDSFGRYVVTTQHINVGEILAIEEPFFKVLKSDSRYDCCLELNKYQRCAVCLKDNLMDLIPCSTCTSTMYCSQNCQKYALKHFHNFECAIIEILLKTGIMQMVMRVFFQSLNIFNGSVGELKKFLEGSERQTCVYDFDFSEANEKARARSSLWSAYHLCRNDKIPPKESPEKLFMLHPVLAEMWEEDSKFIKDFISRILQIGDSNFHGICGWSIQRFMNYEPQMVGVGCYPFISLINHSCAPNVNRIYAEGKMFILAERPILKGEQLFDCYRSTFAVQPKVERQNILFDSYSFRCQCEACVKNFPLFHALKSFDKRLLKYAKKCKNDASKLESGEAKRRFIDCCAGIQDHCTQRGFPSAEIVLLQECLQQLLSIIIKPKVLFP